MGCIATVDRDRRTIWIADAHRNDGKRFVVRADEKLTAFLELESAIRVAVNCLDKQARFLPNSPDMKTSIPPVLITFGLVCFALVQNTQAVVPAPDGGYPGGNTAEGQNALFSLTTGLANTAIGEEALKNNTTGNENTAIGEGALKNNTTGSKNTALGDGAGFRVTTADHVICIGTQGLNVSRSCFIGHIRGIATANADAIPVLIDSAGQLGTLSSSRRFKKEIKTTDRASESILALKPVTFHYKGDAKDTPQFG